MFTDDGNLLLLTGGSQLKVRVQHPGIHERTGRGGTYWFFRYRDDILLPSGKLKPVRKCRILGPSKGANRLSKKQAEVERDKFLAQINKPTLQEKVAEGLIPFSKMVERFKAVHVLAEVARRFVLKKPTREKYLIHLERRILPKWGDRRLCDIKSDEVQQWLFDTCDSWHMMNDLRGLMSSIYAKAEDWGYWPEGRRNPISRVNIGPKWSVRPERIPTQTETVKLLARLVDPTLLIVETAIATGARISEILGLKWCDLSLKDGVIQIERRNWRGDIDVPKSKTSRRTLTLGTLVDRFRLKARAEPVDPDQWVFVRSDGSGQPLCDSGVRQAIKRAAVALGIDFPGFGLHSFRRANITWLQEVGASSIETSKMAGHSTVRMTEEYTHVQLGRQEQLTRLIQERLAETGEHQTERLQ